jgi:hypothetical protein
VTSKLWGSKREALRETLKELRIENELTQAPPAAKLFKPQSYVSKHESGERKLDFVEVLDVAETITVEYDVLLRLYLSKLNSSVL